MICHEFLAGCHQLQIETLSQILKLDSKNHGLSYAETDFHSLLIKNSLYDALIFRVLPNERPDSNLTFAQGYEFKFNVEQTLS